MQETGICNNCNSNNYEVLYKRNKAQINQVVKCKNCGLMYAYPLNINLEEEFWEGSTKKVTSFTEHFSLMIDQKEQLQINDYLSSIKWIEKLLPKKGKALEIGSSRGYFLHELDKRGWDVTGIEPSENRREEAKKIFGYNFLPVKIEDACLQNSSFDAIFMFHVIEHLLNPSEVIEILYTYLKKRGILVIETPTYDSFTFKILRHRERSIRCNSHFFFFTKKTLKEMVEKKGFVIVRHDRVGRTLTLERLCWNISVILKNESVEKLMKTISSGLKLANLKINLNMGDMQRIYCQKI